MKAIYIVRPASIVFLSCLFISVANAQSSSIFGSNGDAKECYAASTNASMTGFASGVDIASCDKAIQYGSLRINDLVATYVNRGILRGAMGDLAAAARDYEKAIRLSPDVAEAYINRGNLWFIAKRYEQAIADYDKSIELNVIKPYVAFLNRGMAYEFMGKYPQARQNYLQALELRQEWKAAEDRLARVTRKMQ